MRDGKSLAKSNKIVSINIDNFSIAVLHPLVMTRARLSDSCKFVKIFRSVSQLTCEIVGTKDGPFFSIKLCGVVKGIADELIGF